MTIHLYSMNRLTRRQQQIFDFIQRHQAADGMAPTFREIAAHFGFRSPRAASDHVDALRKKGFVQGTAGLARSLRIVPSPSRKPVADIPLFGSIPAGFADKRDQEARGCVSVDIGTLGIKPTARTFALEVRGDSMIGKSKGMLWSWSTARRRATGMS
jgi:repressor LexA